MPGCSVRSVAADLQLVLAEHIGDATRLVGTKRLQTAKLSGSDLANEAIAREAKRCAAIGTESAGSFVLLLADPDPVPCVLVPDYWRDLAAKLRTKELLVSVPTTQGVLVLAGHDEAGRAELRTLSKEASAATAHPVSNEVLRWTAEGWTVVVD